MMSLGTIRFVVAVMIAAQFTTVARAAGQLVVPPGSTIVAEGDSLTYGQDGDGSSGRMLARINGASQPRSVSPYPEALKQFLCNRVDVINHGFPGDRAGDALSRWKASAGASLVIVMFGTNDANFPEPENAVPISDYIRNLTGLIEREQKAGAQVIVLGPPSPRDAAIEAAITPYRKAAEETARLRGVRFLDARALFSEWSDYWTDGLHLKPEAYRQLAAGVAAMISINGCQPVSSPM